MSEQCHAPSPAAELIRDPVCGMSVARDTAEYMIRHKGERYYFCCKNCALKFEADPESYLGDRPKPAPMPKGTRYTCPMDPEIIQDTPDLRHGAGTHDAQPGGRTQSGIG